MKLRNWQSECAELALNHFNAGDRHFLCLATPASGKTLMAAEVAAKLAQSGSIDFVLCFSPSVSIKQSIKDTFSSRLNCRFDGVIGAIGCSYTYQSILFFEDDFWQLLNNHRVLVIFDEIHHCVGSTLENAWGEEIIANIQSQAAYTLALTGTPWRTNKAPIPLSRYFGPDNKIQCDYIYGLKEAVQDRVCRNPKIVLIDNDRLSVTDEENQSKTFGSFKELLKGSFISYQDVISNVQVIHHVLNLGCNKLAELRKDNLSAGGLVVASSVEHASQIIIVLRDKFQQSAVMVTYKEQAPAETINQFRSNNIQWVVSVGMISEGTDIPRLQVCCHLSRVKTELYFRQVLGRILRVNDAVNQDAWLYTFAEPKLTEFAYRIEQELPDQVVIIKNTINDLKPSAHAENQESPSPAKDIHFDGKSNKPKSDAKNNNKSESQNHDNIRFRSFNIIGGFREQVIATFESPF